MNMSIRFDGNDPANTVTKVAVYLIELGADWVHGTFHSICLQTDHNVVDAFLRLEGSQQLMALHEARVRGSIDLRVLWKRWDEEAKTALEDEERIKLRR